MSATRQRITEVVENIWQNLKCGDLLDTKNDKLVILVTDRLNCSDAWELIHGERDNGLPIAAVYEEAHQLFSGYFDLFDIAVFMLRQVANFRRRSQEMTQDLGGMASLRQQMMDVKLTHVATMSAACPFVPVKTDSLVVDTLRRMLSVGVDPMAVLENSSGSHIGAAATDLKGLISSTKVLRHIKKRMISYLGPFCDMTLSELGLDSSSSSSSSSKLHTWRWDRTLMSEVLEFMRDSEGTICSVPCVDEDGVLMDQVSVLDIQHIIEAEDFDILEQTCREFLTNYRPYLEHLRPEFNIIEDKNIAKDVYLEHKQGFALRKSPTVRPKTLHNAATDVLASVKFRHGRRASMPAMHSRSASRSTKSSKTSGMSKSSKSGASKFEDNLRSHTRSHTTHTTGVGDRRARPSRRASISFSHRERKKSDSRTPEPDSRKSAKSGRRASIDYRNFDKDEADAYLADLKSYLTPKRAKNWAQGYHIAASDTLQDLIDKFFEKDVPSLWVVDDPEKPIPKVQLQPADVLRLLHVDNLDKLLEQLGL